ncbi:hypothetical protein M569_11127, partial [Genlisea aurea]
MPPKSGKRRAAGPGSRRGRGRGRGIVAKALAQDPVQPEESTLGKDEEVGFVGGLSSEVEVKASVEEEKNVEIEEKMVDKEALEGAEMDEIDEAAKEFIDESEKDEKLDLEDNDPDYEPEEYSGVDDEREIEKGHQDAVVCVEEDPDEVIVEDEGHDIEELEDVNDEPEEEEEEEEDQVVEGHAEMVDAAEDEEHNDVFKERRKRKEFEIFVGGLDKDATEGDLRKVFSEVGEVTEVRLMMNAQTKKNKGFAFLRFASVDQAKRACTQLKNPLIHGKQCGVTASQDSDTLFLGNICRAWTKETLKEKLKRYGVENIEDLTLVEDSNNAGMNRGFAFLEFSSRSDAMDAFKRLQKGDVVFGVDRPAKVSFADSFIDPGDEIMAQVKTVFVDGLSASWDEEHVKGLLKQYGKIEKVELARNMPSARRKDFGFVTFDTHDAAVTCAKSINNEDLGEGDNKAKVRARLSRPLQRGKGKQVGRGDTRTGHGSSRGGRKSSWSHCSTRDSSLHRSSRGTVSHPTPPVDIHERRPFMSVHARTRPAAPLPRPYDRRPPISPYSKGDARRDYGHHEELHPRGRQPVDFSFRAASDRRPPYRDNNYVSRASRYPDMPRDGASRSATRRSYVDDGYVPRYERPPLNYRECDVREYDSISGSKRTFATMDDVPPRYKESGMRHSRPRLDYEFGSGNAPPHYNDAYVERRLSIGYGGSRSSMSSQESHRHQYNGRQGSMGYSGGGPYDSGGMYSSSFGDDYISRGTDV